MVAPKTFSRLFFSHSFNFRKERASRKTPTPEKEPIEINDKANTQTNDTESCTNSFIAEIKNAAHQAQNEMGFIYEPTSGLYYDSRTGYYYNAVCLQISI